nr:hypothetical protein [Candidatus Sigynarchaeota archaeon]
MEYEIVQNDILRIRQPKYEELGGEKAKDPKKGYCCITAIILLIPGLLSIPAIITREYALIFGGIFFGAGFIIAAYVFIFSGGKKVQCIKNIIVNPEARAVAMQLEYHGRAIKEKVFNFEEITAIALDNEATGLTIGNSAPIYFITWRVYLILSNSVPVCILNKLAGRKQFNIDDAKRMNDLVVQICQEITTRVRSVNPSVQFNIATQRDQMVRYRLEKPKSGLGFGFIASIFFMLGLIIGVPIIGIFLMYPQALMQIGEVGFLLVGIMAILILACGPIHFYQKKKSDERW